MITNGEMNTYLLFMGSFALFIVITIMIVFYKGLKRKEELELTKHQNKTPSKQNNQSESKSKTDEVMDTLEWMYTSGIIDSQTYNQLIVKCLPYL